MSNESTTAITPVAPTPAGMTVAKHEKISMEKINKYLNNLGCPLPDNLRETFVEMAIAQNLNPFKREIYGIPYKNRKTGETTLSIVTGYEVYLRRAESTAQLDGWKVWTEGTGREMVAKIMIHRRDREHPFEWEIDYSEYGQDNSMWRSKPKTMLKKVVVAQGFRLCFPSEFQNMPYIVDEVGDDTEILVANHEGSAEVSSEPAVDQAASQETMEKLDELLSDERVPKEVREKYGQALAERTPTQKEAEIALARLHAQILKATATGGDVLDTLRKKMHVMGVECYGDGWDKERPTMVSGINKDKTSSNELDQVELREMISRLELIQSETNQEDNAAGQE